MQIQNRLNAPNFGKIFNVQYYLNHQPATPEDLLKLKERKKALTRRLLEFIVQKLP